MKQKNLVSNDMLDLFAIIGDTEECIDKIEALIRAGVSQLVVGNPIGPDIIKSIKTIGKNIIPVFNKED